MSKDFLFPAHISLDGDGSAAAHYDVVNHPFGSGPIRHIILLRPGKPLAPTRLAMAAPIPRLAPVTMTARRFPSPESRIFSAFLLIAGFVILAILARLGEFRKIRQAFTRLNCSTLELLLFLGVRSFAFDTSWPELVNWYRDEHAIHRQVNDSEFECRAKRHALKYISSCDQGWGYTPTRISILGNAHGFG